MRPLEQTGQVVDGIWTFEIVDGTKWVHAKTNTDAKYFSAPRKVALMSKRIVVEFRTLCARNAPVFARYPRTRVPHF